MTIKLHKIRKLYSFHKKLNPKIWDNKSNAMHPEIRIKLLKECKLFYDFLGVKGLKINDIIVAGSNAGYNYNEKSDLDVHIIVDFTQVSEPDLLKNLCDTKRFLWSFYYSIKMHNIPTEMYVQDASQPVESNGIYSILNGTWLKEPVANNPDYNDAEISQKICNLKKDMEQIINVPSVKNINYMLRKIHNLRTSGLETGGEYSTENIVYKLARSLGYIDKLVALRQKLIDREFSLK